MFFRRTVLICLFLASFAQVGQAIETVKGFSITEIGDHLYDAYSNGPQKTEAQLIVDRLYATGVRHINLSPRGVMTHPRSNTVTPFVPSFQQDEERERYLRLISYIHQRGMTVGIRPIFFVVDALGNTPYVETFSDGTTKVWWHGNIQPQDPFAWFNSFSVYLERYLTIARLGHAEEFTLGAELQSMTVGIGAEWPLHPDGFAGQWRTLLSFAKDRLPPRTRVMYDINYTDAVVWTVSGWLSGGELAVWREKLINGSSASQDWTDLAQFWMGLGAVGVDMYRSLATYDDVIPEDYTTLVALLQWKTDTYAAELDGFFNGVATRLGVSQLGILKELGYRSIDRGFIDPFVYSGPGALNLEHQAAAFEAVLRSFQNPGLPWFGGVVFWDASVDMDRHGPFDVGFSPIGKEPAENVLRAFFNWIP